MASQSMYKHLWIPKRTARDWGKTEYHIIRNWTPREPKQTNNQSDHSRNLSDHSRNQPDHSTNQPDQSPPHPVPATGQGSGTGSHVAGDMLDNIEDQGLLDNELQAAETSLNLTATSSLRSLQRGSEGRGNVGAGREVESEQNEDSNDNDDNETRLLLGRKRRRAASPEEGEGRRGAGSPEEGEGRRGAGSPEEREGRRGAGSPEEGEGRRGAGSPEEGEGRRGAGSPEEGERRRGAGSPGEGEGRRGAGSPEEGEGRRGAGSPEEGEGRRGAGSPEEGEGRRGAGSPEEGEGRRGAGSPEEGEGRRGAGSPEEGEGRRGAGSPEEGEGRRGAGSPEEGKGRRGAGGSVVKKARLRHSLNTESGTEEEGEGGEMGGEGGKKRGKEVTNTLSGIDHSHGGEVDQIFERSLRSDKRKYLSSSDQSSTEKDRSPQPPRVIEKRRLHTEPVRLGCDVSGEEETLGGSESMSEGEPETTAQQKKRSRGKGKRKASKTTSFKLWQSHYQRSGRDLNELDICFALYDSAVRDAIDEEADPLVQSALVRHWKLTKRHILSTIRDLSVVSALEKKYRQELTKHRKLQQESLAMLRTLRQVNGHYLEAASKARSAREAHKLSVQQSEIEELSQEISSYAAKHNTRQ